MSKLYTTDNYSGTMNLTEQQKIRLSQVIHESFSTFYEEELKFQVESLKDDDELDWESILSDTRGDTLYWLEEMMNDCDQEQLKPGGLYHWMVLAYEEGSLHHPLRGDNKGVIRGRPYGLGLHFTSTSDGGHSYHCQR